MIGLTRRGPRGADTVIFLHGGVINRHMWEPVVDHLEADYECMAIDLPGHGDRMADPFTVDAAVDVTLEAADLAPSGKVALVGLSLGGYVAQAFTAAHSELVTGLVLSGSTIRYTGRDGLSTRLYGYLFPLMARPARKAFAEKATNDLGERARPIIEGGLGMKGGAQALRRLPGTDYAAAMTGFGGPIIMANGERDTSNRDAERLFREHHPHAESVVIRDAGHACALQQPETFADAVRLMLTRTPVG